jgi:pilus assembly protein CpaB
MPAKAILALLFLISLAVVVILGLRALPHRIDFITAPPNEVLVAAAALPAGTLLRAKDMAWQPNAAGAASGQIVRPTNSASKLNSELDQQAFAELYGAALRDAVKAHEPITRNAVAKPGDRDFLQVVLVPGARGITIPVTKAGVSTGVFYPGDRVDVILTQTFKGDLSLARRSVGETVVENLRVLALDPSDAKSSGSNSAASRTVTLEVTPEQAERVYVAGELGKLSLTLRSASTSAGVAEGSGLGPVQAMEVRPIWAGDVSPALGDVMPASTAAAVDLPTVEVIHGSKIVTVKSR